jgi:hypothetical protein
VPLYLLLQRVALSKPAHLHQPIDNPSRASQGEPSAGTQHKRDKPQINVGGQAAVETQFGPAVAMTRFDGGEV